MRFQFNNQSYQIQAMPFGWALSPWWANKFTGPIKAWMNNLQWDWCWWVDDILLLAQTKQEVERRATMLIHKLTQLGIQVNVKKSMTEASQQVVFVGHQFNLQTNCVTPTNEKQSQTMLRIKHQEKGQSFQPRALAGLAGNLNDAVKSNVALQGLPQHVLRHAAQGVRKNCTSMVHWQKYKCWLQTVKKMPSLIKLLQQCK